jgi:hypothetical protein
VADGEDLAVVARELLDINLAAVNNRYREKLTPEDFGPPFGRYRDPGLVDAVQLYKSLACFEYQCDEGQPMTARQTELMARVRREVERHRVPHDSPEFQAASWG